MQTWFDRYHHDAEEYHREVEEYPVGSGCCVLMEVRYPTGEVELVRRSAVWISVHCFSASPSDHRQVRLSPQIPGASSMRGGVTEALG